MPPQCVRCHVSLVTYAMRLFIFTEHCQAMQNENKKNDIYRAVCTVHFHSAVRREEMQIELSSLSEPLLPKM